MIDSGRPTCTASLATKTVRAYGKDLSGPLTPIRLLRNRIAHHEPILAWDLPKHHDAMLRITGWLSPAAAAWCRALNRFDQVYPCAGIELRRRDEEEPEGGQP